MGGVRGEVDSLSEVGEDAEALVELGMAGPADKLGQRWVPEQRDAQETLEI